VYDYSMFWVNVRNDAARRFKTFAAAKPAPTPARKHR
jgi:hypothetical protein